MLTADEKRERNRLRVNAWRAANRERVRQQSKERWATDEDYRERQRRRRKEPSYREAEYRRRKARRCEPRSWIVDVLRDIRRRCRKQGIPFDLEPGDLEIPELCPVFAKPFVFGEAHHPLAPTVDRLIPVLGYTKGNVSVISRRANTMKSDCCDPDEVRRLADWMTTRLDATPSSRRSRRRS